MQSGEEGVVKEAEAEDEVKGREEPYQVFQRR
jgi:hypothetical protein